MANVHRPDCKYCKYSLKCRYKQGLKSLGEKLILLLGGAPFQIEIKCNFYKEV